MEAIDKCSRILNHFSENQDDFMRCLEDLNNYNGYLGDDEWIPMEEFDSFISHFEPMEIASCVYYGNFSPRDRYWRFDVYGNLESSFFIDYDDYFNRAVIEDMIGYRDYIDYLDTNEKLHELFYEEETDD